MKKDFYSNIARIGKTILLDENDWNFVRIEPKALPINLESFTRLLDPGQKLRNFEYDFCGKSWKIRKTLSLVTNDNKNAFSINAQNFQYWLGPGSELRICWNNATFSHFLRSRVTVSERSTSVKQLLKPFDPGAGSFFYKYWKFQMVTCSRERVTNFRNSVECFRKITLLGKISKNCKSQFLVRFK